MNIRDYFSPWVFRTLLFLTIGVAIITMFDENFDFSNHVSYYCPEQSTTPCLTEIYSEYCGSNNPFCSPIETIRLNPGERGGYVPGWWMSNYGNILLLFTTFAFLINHLLFIRRSGKWF